MFFLETVLAKLTSCDGQSQADLLVAGVDNEGPSLYFMVSILALRYTDRVAAHRVAQGLLGKFREGEQGASSKNVKNDPNSDSESHFSILLRVLFLDVFWCIGLNTVENITSLKGETWLFSQAAHGYGAMFTLGLMVFA